MTGSNLNQKVQSYIFTPMAFEGLSKKLLKDIQLLPLVSKVRSWVGDLTDFEVGVTSCAFGIDPETDNYGYWYVTVLFSRQIHVFFTHCHPSVERKEPAEVLKILRGSQRSR